jgi:S1-C subfamily serine protease
MNRALDSTIAITTDDGRVYCSGFITEGYVVTAAHCVDGDLFVNVRTRAGERHLMRVVRIDVVQDVAALKVVDGWKPGKGIPLARTAPDYGDEVFVLGHSKGELEYSLTRGIVSHPRRLDGLFTEMVWMQHDAGSVGGNSGGPVMDSRGRLVGLTSFGVLGRTFCQFGCSGILSRTHISGAAHHESLDALLSSLR